ncbi:hypothetical protein [Nocardioides yefusunii]|uniref:Uncharacterized protein n=1 Tax=Nocardioides yefusunii TaxID=2500546 RepID=A0ABW1QWH8_9ACTN|nr:hypothetical protein [Nocardioides yefusunii]
MDVADPLDVNLTDVDLMGEVELTTMLMVAASASDEPLEQEQIDKLLGLAEPAPEAPGMP